MQPLVLSWGTEIAGSACSEVSKSNVVASSVDSQLQVDKRTRETRVGNKHEQFRVTECGTEENHDGSIPINVRGINQPLRLLVDTGAQISVLKRNLIPDNVPVNTVTQY